MILVEYRACLNAFIGKAWVGRHTGIQHWGNLKAIDYVLGRPVGTASKLEHWDPKQQTSAQLLECLGSTELETLVGKLFEASGCHVPAYLGGTLRDIDIFAYNDGHQPINVGGIQIPGGKRISIQVKTWSEEPRSQAVDYLISLTPGPDPKSFGPDWLLGSVKQSASVLVWMKRSLNWLPRSFLNQFGL